MDRRRFLKHATAGGAALGFGPGFWHAAFAAPAEPGPGPYGPIGPSNLSDVLLPDGFTARVIAVGGVPVGALHGGDIPFVWPALPDGAACYPTDDGGWILACNSEVPRDEVLRTALGLPIDVTTGGASSIRFAADGTVVDAYSILTGTDGNCAGGPTPWRTWLSCEEPQIAPRVTGEFARGAVWECDPYEESQGTELPAMGIFKHEAVAIDPVNEHAFLTEDETDGNFYRFVPDSYPDLSAGTLQTAIVADDGTVTWVDVPDPSAATTRTAHQVEGATTFDGGEGIWYDSGFAYFTTKNDHVVWVHDIAAQTITKLYDAADHAETPLGPAEPDGTSVDNICVSSSGDVFVAEDGGNLEIVIISADEREVAPIMRLESDAHADSEICGPCFSPDGTRLYFSSQRGNPAPAGVEDPTGQAPIFGNGFGVTYEVTGPFRTDRVGIAAVGATGTPEPVPTATTEEAAPAAQPARPRLPATGGGAPLLGALGAAGAALLARRRLAAGEPPNGTD